MQKLQSKFNFLLFLILTLGASMSYGAPVECLRKGCYINNNSDTLVIFFRGLRGGAANLNEGLWKRSSREILTQGRYNIQRHNKKVNIYSTGSAHLGLSNNEIQSLMRRTGAQKVVLASHSAGWRGLNKTVATLSQELKNKVSSVQLLDNFYSRGTLAATLKNKFGKPWLRRNCFGFVTAHLNSRYNSHYKSICPNVDKRPNHFADLRCMAQFVEHRRCNGEPTTDTSDGPQVAHQDPAEQTTQPVATIDPNEVYIPKFQFDFPVTGSESDPYNMEIDPYNAEEDPHIIDFYF